MPSGMTHAENETVKRLFVAKEVLEEMSGIESESSIAFQGTELGSVEGDLVEAIAHYGKPAVRIRGRVSEQEIPCVLPSNREDEIGKKHPWNDLREGQRYVVTGEIKRKANGDIACLLVDNIHAVEVEVVDLDRIADPDFTVGKSPVEYIDDLWGD